MDKRTCCCQLLSITLLEKMLDDNYHVLYILVGWSNYNSTSLENVFSWLYLIHFTELYVWICPMIFYPNFSSMDFTWRSFLWTLLYLSLLDIQFKWIQMEFTWHDIDEFYLSWYSITFTGDCFLWALLFIVFGGLTWDTPQLNFTCDWLKGTWDAIPWTFPVDPMLGLFASICWHLR